MRFAVDATRIVFYLSISAALLAGAGCSADERSGEDIMVLALGNGELGVESCPRGYNVIEGTEGDDIIKGTWWRDCIVAYGGDDVIESSHGNDIVLAGAGDDWIETGNGRDQVYGGEGDDVIILGRGSDGVVHGGPGDDLIDGGNGRDGEIYGDEGDDIIRLGNGRDTAFGGEGNDLIEGGRGRDRLNGGPGHDVILGGWGWDIEDGEGGYDACLGAGCEVSAWRLFRCEDDSECEDGYWCVLPGGLCVPPDGRDSNGVNICNGNDDDNDGEVDEDYFPEPTACEVGGCSAIGALQCVDGIEIDSCPIDPVCVAELDCSDATDNDGDGDADCADADCAQAPECLVPQGDYGDPCETTDECGAVGEGAYCVSESESGHPDGYCSRLCPAGTNCCPAGMILHAQLCKPACNAVGGCDDDRMTCHLIAARVRACLPYCYECSQCDSDSCTLFPRLDYGICL